MADSTQASTTIDAPPQDVLAVIADVESYPEWAGGVKEAEVRSRGAGGRPEQACFSLDSGPLKDTYVLAYTWGVGPDGTGTVSWQLVDAQVITRLDGEYRLSATRDGGTEVTYRLAVDVRIPMLGMLKRKAEKVIIDTALKDLKKRVEA
jgi:ribosome-associated toxin RatA of RatAB toxin-antitoxin module